MKESTKYSSNFLNDLTTSLEESLSIFKTAVISGMKYDENTFLYMAGMPTFHEKENFNFFKIKGIKLMLKTYNQAIGVQHLSERSQDWKRRLRAFYQKQKKHKVIPAMYSKNILTDLIQSLENAPRFFKALVCEKLKWDADEFDRRRKAKIENDYGTYIPFNEQQIGCIIPLFHEQVVKGQINNKALSWQMMLKSMKQ